MATEKDKSTRAAVIVPFLIQSQPQSSANGSNAATRSAESRLEEARGLAHAIQLDVCYETVINIAKPRPGTLIGTGKISELARIIADNGIELAVIDHSLTPVQQRNLEKALNAKVLDRTGLILEIFGERARTKEGVLQVELAHLNYQRGRLVRSWTHLERQRGGAGFLGGPGETQIEADRRILRDKIVKVKRELDTVRRTRTLHRSKRKKIPFPVIAIVGYTNAGKSSLFNKLTGSDVVAKDMLFATLDPTLRRLKLPHGTSVIISDTVGFISDLPTHLVAAFRATLEEVVEADLILHVRDMSDPEFSAQADDVERILADLGINPKDTNRIVDVWNKSDLIADTDNPVGTKRNGPSAANGPVVVSAKTGAGLDDLLARIETLVSGNLHTLTVRLDVDEVRMTDWLYRNSHVVCRKDRTDGGLDLVIQANEHIRSAIEKQLGRTLRN